jgi:hypothetical protein
LFYFPFLILNYRGKLHASNIFFIYLSLYFYIFHFLMGLLLGIPLEAAQSSSFSELLLQIDTMVISGMISMTEASDLREKLVTNRSIIQSTFSDIHHKPNTELLSELQLFLRKPIEYATTYLIFFFQFYRLYSNFLQCCGIPMSIFYCCHDNLTQRIAH